MRWWVETTDLDGVSEAVELAVEASSCLGALAAAAGQSPAGRPPSRRAPPDRSDPGGQLSLELLGSGVRAVDWSANRRYVVLPAPTGAALAELLDAEGVDAPPPSYEIVLSRDHDPTPELPLTYRERGVRVAPNVSAEGAASLLWQLLEDLRGGAVGLPPGKVFELAAFTGFADAAELPPPLVSLSYKDWRQEAEVVFAGASAQGFVLPDEAFSGE